MGYGLRATATGGEFQIDSSLNTTVHLAVHTKGSFTSAGGKLVIDIGDLVFARAYNSNGTLGVNVNRSAETVNGVSYAKGRVYTFYAATDYIVTKPSTNATAFASSINATGYGVQVKNYSGNVCFDSRIVTSGFEITQVHAKYSMAGLASNISGYNASNNIVFAGAANTFNVNHASHRKIYVSLAGAEYNPSVTSGFTQMSFKYNSSTNQIFYEGWLSFTLFSAYQIAWGNMSEILVGELTE